MSHRILIVDDDDDFRSLLSDLYHQAGYEVKSMSHPIDALKVLEKETFDLCVTDQSMPDLKGIDFIEKCRTITTSLPIIMVSAYLSDELMGRLKSMKIEVFHKPLNIMSLLRKTSELIQAGDAGAPPQDSEQVFTEEVSAATPTPKTKFRSFALKSDASKRLKKEFDAMNGELPNLVLVGDPGTHFKWICEDIERQTHQDSHHFVYLSNPKTNVFEINKLIAGQPSAKALVFVIFEAYDLGASQRQTLLKLYKKSGPFAGVLNAIKFIFCLNEDLDTQFASGSIDEDFYLILGQKEIYIPRLNLCKEDIPALADQIGKTFNQSHAENTFHGFDPATAEVFMSTEWEHNYESLEKVVLTAIQKSPSQPITVETLKASIANPTIVSSPQVDSHRPNPTVIHDPKRIVGEEDSEPQITTEQKPPPKPLKPKSTAQPKIIEFTDLADERDLARRLLKP